MRPSKLKTKILVDGGDPEETLRVKQVLGFVDGQTTNPTLIAKNPDIQRRIASGHTLSALEEKDAYRKIVQVISPLVGDAGVSIEVFADVDTTAKDMLAQGEEMFRGFRMPTSSTHVSARDCGQRKCPWRGRFASI